MYVHVFGPVTAAATTLPTFEITIDGLAGFEVGSEIATAALGTERVLVVGIPGAASGGGGVQIDRKTVGTYTFVESVSISVSAGDRVGDALDAAYVAFNRLSVLVGAPGEAEAYYVLIEGADGDPYVSLVAVEYRLGVPTPDVIVGP